MAKINIQSVSDGYLCSACGACSAICPKNAVDFNITNIGRLYAKVNESCIDCGLCTKVCPSLNEPMGYDRDSRFEGDIKKVFVGKSNDEKIFQNAQSGGVATGVLAYLFERSLIDAAVVCQMKVGKTPKVESVIIESKDSLAETQKSCYTPVSLLISLQKTSKYKSVAIVGLPCHLEGVRLLQSQSHLFTNIKYKIGLICDRTLCAGIQNVVKDYVGYKEFRIHWKQKYDEKQKIYRYRNAPVVVISKTGEYTELPKHYRLGLKEMFTPPRCRVCWDKLNVFSDISLGDPWRVKNVDWQKGESLIICRTVTGDELIEKMENEGVVSIRPMKKNVPLMSQVISERKEQVSNYSRAFSIIPHKVDSYLIDSDKRGSDAFEKSLMEFIENENLDQDSILEKAYIEIERFEKEKKKNRSIVNRIFKKINSILG